MASGSGSNAENLLNHSLENKRFTVKCIITDQESAGVISRVERFKVPCLVIPFEAKKKSKSFSEIKKDQETRVLETLKEYNVEWVFLAGYMRILSSDFIDKFWDADLDKSKIVNIHPALLPAFPGVDAYRQAWDAGVKESGATVHHVDAGVDTGPIILQESFMREEGDDFNSFKARGLEVEYKLYKKAVDKLFTLERAL